MVTMTPQPSDKNSAPRRATRAQVRELEDAVAERDRRIAHLEGLVEEWVPMFGGLNTSSSSIDLTMTGARELMAVMADAMVVMLGEADNYVECDVQSTKHDGKRYTMTIRRYEKPTPHELRQRFERERDEALARVAQLESQLATVVAR